VNPPTLRLTRPHWLDADTDLSADASALRRLVRAIRGIAWPGVAQFAVSLGPGTCKDYEAVAFVRLVATSTSDAHRSALRRAWDDAAR
jgi:hypothetical protein